MPDFVYTARNPQGEDITGKLTAGSKREAIESLSRQSLFPILVEDALKGQIQINLFQRKVPTRLVSSTLSQFADLLENGVPVLSALNVLSRQTSHPTLRDVMTDIQDQIADGKAIDEAFAAHPKVFSDLTISIIRAGAEGSFLEDSLKRVASFLEKQEEMKGKIVGAMIYPAILTTVGVTVVFVLLTFFVPKFETMFDMVKAQGGTLPITTIGLISANEMIQKYWFWFGGGIVLAVFWFRGQMKTRLGRRLTDRWKLKLPIFGKVFLAASVSRFCRVLGTLLENGVPILRALEISSHSTGNVILADAINQSAANVSSGEQLSRPLAECGIIPPQVMAMISVAEESNTLENVLIKVADNMERDMSRQIDMMLRMLEPLLLLALAGAVLFIMISLLLPIFQMGTSA